MNTMNIEGLKAIEFDAAVVPNPTKPVVFVSGSYKDMGIQYGMQQKELIKRNASLALSEANDVQGSREQVFRNTVKYRDITYSRAPEIVEMWEGIAEGAEVPFEQIVLLNCKIPISYGVRTCSAISAWGKATEDGRTIAAGNVDGRIETAFFGVVLIAHPDQGNAIIASIDLAGQICGGFCINEKGLIGMMTGGQAGREEDRQAGYDPTGMVIKTLLTADNVEEAVNQAKHLNSFSGLSLLLADKSGSALVYEHTSALEAVRKPGDFGEDDYIGIANHYLCDVMQAAHEEYEMNIDSYIRQSAEFQKIKESYGDLNIKKICDIMSTADLWDMETKTWKKNFYPETGYDKENECEPNMRGILYQTTTTCAGIAETGELYIRVGCNDKFMSYMPQYLGELAEISLKETELESVLYAEDACCRELWNAGKLLSTCDEGAVAARQFLSDARTEMWKAQNYKIQGNNADDKKEKLFHYANAATSFMRGQVMAKSAGCICR